MSISDELQKESKVAKPTDDEGLKLLSTLALTQLDILDQIKKSEDQLSTLKEKLAQVAEKEIPDLMTEYGFAETPKLSNGLKITLKDNFQCSITKTNQVAAFKWLKENGHDDVIKNEVKTLFGRGEEAQAKSFYHTLMAKGLNCSQKASVHFQTLKALLTDLKSQGVDIPNQTFSVFEGKIAVIK